MKNIPWSHGLLVGWFLLFISGCETTLGPASSAITVKPMQPLWSLADAHQLLERGSRAHTPDQANDDFLEAARIFLALGDSNRAAGAYALISPLSAAPKTTFQYRLFHLELLLDSSRVDDAWREGLELQPQNTSQLSQLLLLRARIAETLHNYRDAAFALMSLPENSANPQAINDKIWQYINLSSINALTANPVKHPNSPLTRIERAWWQLALVLQEGFDPAEQRDILKNWLKMHPNHPAGVRLPTSLVRLLSAQEKNVRVALMLPLSGPLGNAGRIVRDGYIAGYLHHAFDASSSHRSSAPLEIFDTNGQDMAALYEQATQAGATFIVGPLSKPRVAALNQLSGRQLPVLALNNLPDKSRPTDYFLQLSLAIEDEAKALSEQLKLEKMHHIALIYGPDSWARRGAEAFNRFWQSEGQANLTSAGFEDPRKITQTVGELLFVGDSIARHKNLDRLLGMETEMVPRSRQDIQALVALVTGNQMLALKPALAFHFAQKTPIYSSSQVVQDLSPQNTSDLAGVHLCEIPWLVGNSALKEAIEAAFPDYNNRRAPLYALGVDAYRLVARMELLTNNADDHIFGGTGILSLGPNGHIERKLVWATIRRGQLEPSAFQ